MSLDVSEDYFVRTFEVTASSGGWGWEIERKSTPLGIRITGQGLHSLTHAQYMGKYALANFLTELSKEEKRKDK